MTDDFRVIPQSNGIDELVRVVNCIHDRIDSVGLSQNGGSTSSPSFSNAFGTSGIVLSEPGASYALPVASTFVLGGVKIGDGVDVGSDGTISVLHNGLSDLQDANGSVSAQHYHINAAQAETVYQLNLAGPPVVEGQQLIGHTDGSFHFGTTLLYSGVTSQPTYLDNGDGTVTVGDGVYSLYDNPNGTGVITSYPIAGNTFTLTDNSTNYIYADYNSGSPILKITTNRSDATSNNFTTAAPIFKVYRNGNNLDQLDLDETGNALSEKTLLRLLNTRQYERESGLAISDAGSQHFDVSAGVIWYAAQPISLDVFHSASNTVHQYAYNGSAWSYTSVSVYNNSQFQDTTGLSTLPAGKYAVNWIYRSISKTNKCFILLGTAAYNLNDAIAAQPPGNTPNVVSTTAMLVGKIIAAYGATTPTAVYSAFDVAYTSGVASGTVTSVGLSLPNIFNVTNSPVTTSGTLTATLASQTANTFFAAPNGSAGTPSFRAVYATDISDSTTAGRTLLTATDAAAQRTALGVVEDSLVVHKAGVETITALKTFTDGVSIGSASGGNLNPNSVGGLQLSGLVGSSYDLSLLNPAGSACYMRVPTGTNVPEFPQGMSVDGLTAQFYKNAGAGTVIRGLVGTVYDLSLYNPSTSRHYMRVRTGTSTPEFPNGTSVVNGVYRYCVDSVGASRRVFGLNASDQFFVGAIDAGWGGATYIGSGGIMVLRVNGSSGAFTNAITINTGGVITATYGVISSAAITANGGIRLAGSANNNVDGSGIDGVVLRCLTGSTNDFIILNAAASQCVMRVPTGTSVPVFPSGITVANGINLGGTANLSSYDEGTWTPTVANLGGTGITYSTKWIRTGNATDCAITISGTGLTSTADSTTLTLPFTPARIAIGNAENGSMSGGVAKAATNGKVYLPTISSTSQINIKVKIFHN